MVGTLKNTLGPHHGRPVLGKAWPWDFRQAPAAGPPPGGDYHTVGYGLFQAPQLVQLYRTLDAAGRSELPALRNDEPLGLAASTSIRIAIRDTGRFMDPRSRKDWWVGY